MRELVIEPAVWEVTHGVGDGLDEIISQTEVVLDDGVDQFGLGPGQVHDGVGRRGSLPGGGIYGHPLPGCDPIGIAFESEG